MSRTISQSEGHVDDLHTPNRLSHGIGNGFRTQDVLDFAFEGLQV